MTSTSRTPYDAQTPDRLTFDPQEIPLSAFARPTFIPTPESAPRLVTNASTSVRNRWKRFSSHCVETFHNNTGLLLVASSGVFGSFMNVMVKKLNSLDPPVPTLEVSRASGIIITWSCCVTYMSIAKIPDPFLGPKGVRILLAFRGFTGFFGLFGPYFSLQYLSLSDATALQFLTPMCTAVAGALLLKEEFKRSQAFASLCSLFGVVLIARPEFLFGSMSRYSAPTIDPLHDGVHADGSTITVATPAERYLAVGAALMGVLGATGAYTSIRAIGKRAHPLHNIVSFSSQCVIVSSIWMLIARTKFVVPATFLPVAMLFAIGIFGFTGQMLMTMGLQRETAGRGTLAVYCQIIYVTIYDRIFFHSSPDPLSIIGTAIIMASAIYVAVSSFACSITEMYLIGVDVSFRNKVQVQRIRMVRWACLRKIQLSKRVCLRVRRAETTRFQS
ncbi:DUF6-domain-containing protein [Amylocystis lapponica]|nr:DUF6-domain-containing protein [Amylocystis lapponica]